MDKFDVFTRTWWRNNPEWPNGLEPSAGRKRYISRGVPESEAFAICQRYAQTHKPGRLSRKAEYERS